ncbi:acyltransferase domain-containing protein, partial [Streptomyces sp. NPDC003691]
MRRAGVSSFGISGTNAHVIVEQAPEELRVTVKQPVEHAAGVGGVVPWVVSGRSAEALRAQAGRLAEALESGGRLADADPGEVARALVTTRTAFEHRAVVVGSDLAALKDGLTALATDTSSPAVVRGTAADRGGVVFVFPGQGSQWAGMAVELLGDNEVFRARIDACEQALSRYVDWSLTEVLRGAPGAPSLDRVDIVQPVLFAVMVSLAEVWKSVGVRPSAVVGHSQGEIAAACVAGALSLEDAAKVVALRSIAIGALAGKGGMASVPLPADEVTARLAPWAERLSVAAVNGPAATVVAGDAEALAAFTAACTADDIRARTIAVDYASHSPHVEAIHDELLRVLDGLEPRSAEIAFYSTLEGRPIDTAALDASYWYRNLRGTVRLDQAVRALAADGYRTFVESSPHPVLTMAIGDTLDDALRDEGPRDAADRPVVTGSLRRDEGGWTRFLTSIATLHTTGLPIDWQAVPGTAGTVPDIDLPTYAFQQQRYWINPPLAAGGIGDTGLAPADHPLLTGSVALADDGLLLTGTLSLRTQPWLVDHAVAGTVLLPGTAFVELALRAAEAVGGARVDDLALEAPLVLTADGEVRLQVAVGAPDENGVRPLRFHARPTAHGGGETDAVWTRHATARLVPLGTGAAASGTDSLAAPPSGGTASGVWPPAGAEPVDIVGLYPRLAEQGYEYGPEFQGLTALWRHDGDLYAEVRLGEEQTAEAARYGIHPALLDAVLHAVVGRARSLDTAGGGEAETADDGPLLPFVWSGLRLLSVGASVLRARITTVAADTVGIALTDRAGVPVAEIGSLALRPIATDDLRALARTADGRDSLFGVEWRGVGVSVGGLGVGGGVEGFVVVECVVP